MRGKWALTIGLAALLGGCSSPEFLNDYTEGSTQSCADGLDNDSDGLTDCQDPGCSGLAQCPGDGGMSWPDQQVLPPADGGAWASDASCAATAAEAKNMVLPVDIIWFVDTSGSMDFETKTVQNNLNAFANSIAQSGIDYHVVIVASPEVCVPPPLGGPGCSDGPRYKHVKLKVGSNDGLEKLLEAYPDYQGFLRVNALRHFVAVSDDNSDKGAIWFDTQIQGLTNPGFPDGYTFHSIVAYGNIPFLGCFTGAAIGSVYLNLTAATSGVKAQVCATDWSPIFAALAQSVTVGTKLPCSYAIPEPTNGQDIDPNKVNVSFTPAGGQAQTLPKVPSSAACQGKQGWYYDDETNPTMVTLCPNSCSGVGEGEIQILFGCKTVLE